MLYFGNIQYIAIFVWWAQQICFVICSLNFFLNESTIKIVRKFNQGASVKQAQISHRVLNEAGATLD